MKLTQQQGYDYCMEAVKLKESLESAFLVLAERLRKIRNERLFEPQWQSFSEYLNELKITESRASRLISVYERFILELKYDPGDERLLKAGGWSNLYELGRLAKNKEEADAWIDRRIGAFEPHFREEMRLAKRGVTECPHSDTYAITICRDCGFRFKPMTYEETPQKNISPAIL